MTFDEILTQVLELLRRDGRVSYRALKRRFDLDEEYLEDLKAEIIQAKKLAVDEDGAVLVWTGGSAPASAPVTDQERAPLAYTPAYLAEKILASRTALEGERKQVTVLFADIKGSMELIEGLDPEEARRLLDPALHIMMEAVHRYEGTVNQVLGDGIMALFGAPVAHEDHAVRACYAALAMQAAMRRHTEEVRQSHGLEMQIRVGLNSGEVVVRAIGNDLHMDYSAVGQTTHLAARMEQLATPGSIRLTATTLRLAEGLVQVNALGRFPVKGLTDPVEVVELAGASAIRRRLQASAVRGLTRFVGRQLELAAFEQALAALQHLPDRRATREQAIDLRFDLRNVLHPLGESGRILNHLRQAEPFAEALGDQRRLGQLAGYMSVCLRHQGNSDEALASAQRALTIATALGDIGLQVAANSFLGELYLWVLNDYRQAAEVFRRNVEILHGALLRERFGTTNVQSVVSRAQVARCLAELGAFAEGRAYGEDALRLAETVDHPYSLVWACEGVGHFFLRQGALSQAIRVFERGLALREAVHFPLVTRNCNAGLGAAYTLSGRVTEALPLLQRAVEQSQLAGPRGLEPLFPVWLGEGYVLAGRLAEAMPLGQQALEVTRTQKHQGYRAYALRLLGEIAAHRGPPDVAQAEDHYRQALALANELGMRPLVAHCHLGLGMLNLKIGRSEQARAELSAAIALYRAMEMTFWLPQAEAALAQVA